MTGLKIEVDRILEIACIITDGKLSSVEGLDLVIHQTQECLDRMGEWCQDHHGASGLTKKVLRREAEKQMLPDSTCDGTRLGVGWHISLLFVGLMEPFSYLLSPIHL